MGSEVLDRYVLDKYICVNVKKEMSGNIQQQREKNVFLKGDFLLFHYFTALISSVTGPHKFLNADPDLAFYLKNEHPDSGFYITLNAKIVTDATLTPNQDYY
jgi:hypothetical protein